MVVLSGPLFLSSAAYAAICSAGGGVVVLDGVSNDPRVPFDACGELERVAQAIESDLPK